MTNRGSGLTRVRTRMRSWLWSASQSSPGSSWKYQTSLPVSTLSASGRVAIELRRRGQRDGVVAAVTFESRVRIGIGDAPIDDFADRIVRARQAPGAGGPLVDRHVAPGVAARLAGRGRDVELPDLLACLGVVRGDETELALPLLTGAVRDHLAIGDQQSAGGDLAVVDLGFPAQLAGPGIERQQKSVRRAEIDHVLVDAEALAARRRGQRRRVDTRARYSHIRSPLVASRAWMLAPGAITYMTPR